MRNPPFVNGSYYHIYNRGVEKRVIFLNSWDYKRFLETINYYRFAPQLVKLSDFRRGKKGLKKIESQQELVRIYCYALMPNHFHFVLQQVSDNGITKFLRDVSNSYTRFFNTKYERVGSLLQGSFKARIIENEEYLLQVSKYVHRNSFPLEMWEGKVYPYSSYGYYLSGEQHPFCETEFILSHFSKSNPALSYQSFVTESEIDEPELYTMFIDPTE